VLWIVRIGKTTLPSEEAPDEHRRLASISPRQFHRQAILSLEGTYGRLSIYPAARRMLSGAERATSLIRSRSLILCALAAGGALVLHCIVALLSPVHSGADPPNPHSDLIFRATGATSCEDCHSVGKDGMLSSKPIDNDLVSRLRAKAKGIHGPGRFADCLRCHAGGSKGVEKY
jgi:hypothetical protein